MRDFFPYNFDELVGGEVRVLVADYADTPMPAGLHDVIEVTKAGTYAPLTGWRDLGATSAAASYSRNLTVAGYSIQQEQTALLEAPSEVTRTLQIQMAEFSPENLSIWELGTESDVATVAAAAGHAAYRHTKVGGTDSLPSFRAAFVGLLNQQQGIVQEPDATKRGRFVGRILPLVAVTADNSALSMGEGALWSGPLTFKSFPDPDQPSDEAEGFWLEETAGTIGA